MKKTNYENGKIYIIVSSIDRNIKYVGSTCDSLSKRLSKHRRNSKQDKYKNRKIYEYYNVHGWSNAEISLLESVNCKTKMDLLMHEREWKDRINPQLNIRNPYTAKDERKEQMKKYYDKNKEEYNKQIVCPCCNMKLTKSCLNRHLKNSCQINLFKSMYMF